MDKSHKVPTNLDGITQRLLPVLLQYDVKRAVVFGSYARGVATEKSDVDILVDSGLKGFEFLGLQEIIECTLGVEVDLFDVTHIDRGSRIDMEIQETGVVIHGK